MAVDKSLRYFTTICCIAGGVLAAPRPDDSYSDPPPTMPGQDGNFGPPPGFPTYFAKVRTAHAVLASAAWLVFFPLGSILIRTIESERVVQIHYRVQIAGFCVFVASAGMGIWMAKVLNMLANYHPVIGMILLGGIALQPLTELLNHLFYQRFPKVIYLAHVHIWLGRLLITVGIIQGGLGFVFAASFPMAKSDPGPRIAYGVVAIVVWILYVSLAIVWPEVKHTFGWWRRRHGGQRDDNEGLRSQILTDMSAPSAINRPNRRRK